MGDESIIESNAAYEAWVSEGADLNAQYSRLMQQVNEERAANEQLLAEHRAESTTAVTRGLPIPPAPRLHTLDRLSAPVADVQRAQRSHEERRISVLAGIARSGGLDACSARLRSLQHGAAEAARAIETARAEALATLTDYRNLIAALDEDDGVAVRPPRSQRVRRELTATDFIESIELDADLSAIDQRNLGLSFVSPGRVIMKQEPDPMPEPRPKRSKAEHDARILAHARATLGFDRAMRTDQPDPFRRRSNEF